LVDPELWLISKNNTTQRVVSSNTGNGEVDINPNPIASPLTILLHDFDATNADVYIVNAGGQLMYRKNVVLFNGAELLTISTSNWAKGIYMVHIKAGDKKIIKRVMR
jgi:hypothetical protein